MSLIINALGNLVILALPVILYFVAALTYFTVEHVRTKLQRKRRCATILANQRCTYRL